MAFPRILAALVAALCALALREITHLWRGAGGSVGLACASAAVALALLVALVLAGAPAIWWRRILAAAGAFRQRLATAESRLPAPQPAWLLSAAAVAWVLILSRYLSWPQNPWDDDQGAFLITAREILERGGIPWLARALVAGEFAEANRHPLYLALLSLHPTFTGGRVLSAAIGSIAFATLVVGLGRRRGWDVAGTFALLLATNAAFARYSSSVVCDILMLWLGGAIWLRHLPRGNTGTESAAVDGMRFTGGSALRRSGASPVAGALLALAWLTKGTGLLLLGGYLAWLAALPFVQKDRPEARRASERSNVRAGPFAQAGLRGVVVLAAFAVVASPLLIRNVRRFGNPFHNVNSLLLFADRYDEFEPMLQQGVTTGEAARAWLEAHSAAEIARRELSGLVWELYIILRSLGPSPLDDGRVLFGAVLAPLAAVGMVTRRSAADGLLLIWGIVCWIVFAWYVPIAAGERFILPLLAPVLATASEALARLARSSGAPPRAVIVLACVWAAAWTAATWIRGVVD